MSYTCIGCSVKFVDANIQREHYKTDWHRYNLKRRVAGLPPVTAEEFQNRLIQQKNAEIVAAQETTLYCNACNKHFSSENAQENHMNSRKHKENCKKFIQKNDKGIMTKVVNQSKQTSMAKDDHGSSEVDSDEWEEIIKNPIADNKCIFCDHQSIDLAENLTHMSVAHSFFVPDVEYCINLEGLLFYLAQKVTRDFICLWCNDRGRTFYSIDAVRKHMIDKGHCKLLHEGLALAEFIEFYDYSSSYPDHAEGMDKDEEITLELLDGDEYQLVLPSGAVIGHRSLLRYYKQRLNPNRSITPSESNRKLHKVLSEYRSLGWTAIQQEAAARKARDIHFLKRVEAKWTMKLSVKANKLQRHFRQQINF